MKRDKTNIQHLKNIFGMITNKSQSKLYPTTIRIVIISIIALHNLISLAQKPWSNTRVPQLNEFPISFVNIDLSHSSDISIVEFKNILQIKNSNLSSITSCKIIGKLAINNNTTLLFSLTGEKIYSIVCAIFLQGYAYPKIIELFLQLDYIPIKWFHYDNTYNKLTITQLSMIAEYPLIYKDVIDLSTDSLLKCIAKSQF